MGSRTDRPPYKPGDIIGRVYRIVRVLAEGGFSVIYEAVDVTVDRTVAVKVLRPGIARMRSYSREQMKRECQVMVRLHEVTPHVVDVLTAGITEDRHALPYYVMERLHGSTMRQGIIERQQRGEHFPIEEVLSFGITSATALARAHALGVVHRDLKPENIFLSITHGGSLVLKLLDFGICVDVALEGEMSEQGRLTCSLPYAAPEQIEGQRVTTATDVYALGLMVIELLTLRLPHSRDREGLTPDRLELALVAEPLPDLSAIRPDAPPRLLRLLERCLGITTESRPTVLDVAKELRDTKMQMEGKLGPQDSSTDVDGPSIEELHRRMQASVEPTPGEGRIVAGGGPVDLHATTEPPSSPRRSRQEEEEVFFVRSTRSGTTSDPVRVGPVPESTEEAPLPMFAALTSPSRAHDVTIPDAMPAFAGPVEVEPYALTQGASIRPMPVVELRDPSWRTPEEEPRVESDTLYMDSERALKALAPSTDVVPPTQRYDAPPAPAFVPDVPKMEILPAHLGAPPQAHRGPVLAQSLSGLASRSEPGPWQTPARAPARSHVRYRVILGLAFAAPVLGGLAVAPLLFRSERPQEAHAAATPPSATDGAPLPTKLASQPLASGPMIPPSAVAQTPGPSGAPPSIAPAASPAPTASAVRRPGSVARPSRPVASTSARADVPLQSHTDDDPFLRAH